MFNIGDLVMRKSSGIIGIVVDRRKGSDNSHHYDILIEDEIEFWGGVWIEVTFKLIQKGMLEE